MIIYHYWLLFVIIDHYSSLLMEGRGGGLLSGRDDHSGQRYTVLPARVKSNEAVLHLNTFV